MFKFLKFSFGFILLNSYFLILPPPVEAHAFGQQYTLPVPYELYAWGSALAIIASFVVIGVFVKAKKQTSYPQKNISNFPLVRFFRNNLVKHVLQLISFLLLLITILSGFLGTQNPVANFNMTFFWILAVLGVGYLTAIFGNLYSTLNPWKAIIEFIEKIIGRQKPLVKYPVQLGFTPALIFYFLFIWIELFGRVSPLQLSLVLLNYSILNIVGWFVFGKEDWFTCGEFFSVFYGVLSQLSLIENKNGRTYLRPPFIGLISANFKQLTVVPFIVFMLSSTAFDGFKETKQWYDFYFNFPLTVKLGDMATQLIGTLGLIITFLLFFSLFYILTFLLKLIAKSKESLGRLLLFFAPSLIPIALAYNVAHYYTLLAIQGQAMISLISDPLGKGWNIFGTANFTPNIALIDVKTIWHTQVAIIILGHIAAVYISHVLTINLVGSTKKAMIAQIPTLILMIAYTVAGLWILAQPLTSGF